jgi:hypothetical protein
VSLFDHRRNQIIHHRVHWRRLYEARLVGATLPEQAGWPKT